MLKLGLNTLIGLILVANFAILHSCQNSTKAERSGALADHFISIYQDRNDFEKFMDCYAEDASLFDMINGDKITGKEALKKFFDWEHSDYLKLQDKSLQVEEQIAQENKVVIKGFFTPFRWGELEVEAMQFTTILHFDANDKISKQIDWINYPSYLVDYQQRKNANEWISIPE